MGLLKEFIKNRYAFVTSEEGICEVFELKEKITKEIKSYNLIEFLNVIFWIMFLRLIIEFQQGNIERTDGLYVLALSSIIRFIFYGIVIEFKQIYCKKLKKRINLDNLSEYNKKFNFFSYIWIYIEIILLTLIPSIIIAFKYPIIAFVFEIVHVCVHILGEYIKVE